MITVLIIVLVSLLIYIKWRQTYWKRRGIVQIDPISMFGTSKKSINTSFAEAVLENYSALKTLGEKHGGLYFFIKPIYMPIDQTIIKHILQTDFNHFTDHGFYHHPKDILSMNLFDMEGDSWKQLRAKLTPTFTPGKMKMMFGTLVEKTGGLEEQLAKHVGNKNGFAIKDILGRFTTDVIASCAFGIECDSLREPNNEFRRHGEDIFAQTLYNKVRFALMNILPSMVLANLGLKLYGLETTKFFSKTVKETIRSRESTKFFRNDFMHLLLQLKNHVNDGIKLTEDEIIAQCFVFFLAGFETGATTMTFALFEIAQSLEIQEKLRREINCVLDKHDNKITYDAVMEMAYLEKVIYETMRKYPPVVLLPRVCTQTYKVPDTDLVVEKGTTVHIPVWGIHRDPEYYPNPEVFNPENFSKENKANRPQMTFIPFGEGPRICIGQRFGLLETRMGLITILRNFKISLNKKTVTPLKMNPSKLILSVKGDVWLNIDAI